MPIISDMPINSFSDKYMALKNAKLLINAGADMVKIEGENDILEVVKYLSINKILVCGHIGCMPQVNKIKNLPNEDLLTKAKNLEEAGLKMLVMSMTSESDDQTITNQLSIPTISFRSSPFCNGEVEVLYDLIGISSDPVFNVQKETGKIEYLTVLDKIENFIKKIHTRKN